jgi:hypothetical protein
MLLENARLFLQSPKAQRTQREEKKKNLPRRGIRRYTEDTEEEKLSSLCELCASA